MYACISGPEASVGLAAASPPPPSHHVKTKPSSGLLLLPMGTCAKNDVLATQDVVLGLEALALFLSVRLLENDPQRSPNHADCVPVRGECTLARLYASIVLCAG